MVQATEGSTVKVHYTGKLEDGTVFGSSEGNEPIEFTIGESQVIPGFERAVIGMQPGQEKTVTTAPEEGYGPHRDEMVVQVGQDKFPEGLQPEIGQELEVRQADEQTFHVRVTDVQPDQVTLDANHPLAGQELTFDIKLMDVV
ncbi:MAG: peptidylprolyl isomerase [Dehalococcoidia bacterium]|nr:peptidylprolyl isomerase [Dehalococcoidia bacterium]